MSDIHVAPPAPMRYVLHSVHETFTMKGVTLHYVPMDERGQALHHDVGRALIAYLTDAQIPGPLPPEATDDQVAAHTKTIEEAKANQWYSKWKADTRPTLEKAPEFLKARLGLT